MGAEEVVAIVRRMLGGHPYGFLNTLATADPLDRAPSARLVQHLGVDDDLTLWIGTSPFSDCRPVGSA